jgi:DNA-binding response OmpR family regulator
MATLSYESAQTLIYDPVSGNRASTRAALYNLGFRHIETMATLEAFAECIKRRPPDLALCEAQGSDSELCAMIQSLRQGIDGHNPFVVIIVTAWENSNALVTRVLNSGADDLLLRPFSTALLGQRIRSHIERRKGFVITSEYVGPDRRRDSSRPSNVELFEPPNSLKMKAQDRLSADEAAQRLDAQLKAARETLIAEKLRRDAFQICVLWRLLQERVPGTEKYAADLARLKDFTGGVALRCRGGEFEAAIEWCDSVLAAAEGLEAGVDRNASMHLLGHAALNLNQVFAPGKTTAQHLDEIDATVAMINARNQPAMAS